ncbi:MAG: SprT family zinc-dependent metalloprotease [Neisseria sp.]|nr:SprT family zinc-dependent metalloprotease [Neisseria sp.]
MPAFPYPFQNHTLHIEHRQNTQKNIILRAASPDCLRIGTPKWFSRSQLLHWLDNHHDLIARTLAKQPKHAPDEQQRPSEIFYRGSKLPLVNHQDKLVILSEQQIALPDCEWPQQQTLLRRFLTEQAAHILLPRLSEHARLHGFPLGKRALSSAKTFWGVCRKHDIRLNWRLIGAPDFVADYVCIHELCHIEHPNHSPAFWNAVNQRTPHTAVAKQWLKTHGQTLFVLG